MNIFKMDFKRGFKSLLIWSGVCAVLTALMLMLYPSMMKSDMIALMNAKIASLPKELVDAFHLSGEDISQFPQFFGYIFQFILMAGCVFGAILGISALSKEESEGTIEFLYAKPLRRDEIVSGKLACVCAEYLIFFFVVGIASILSAIVVGKTGASIADTVSSIKMMLLGGMISGFTYLFIGFAVSVFLRNSRHAASIAVALFFSTYILGLIPTVMGVLDFLKWISPMNYFIPKDIVMNGISGLNVIICLLIMGISTVLTYGVYRKKDFAI